MTAVRVHFAPKVDKSEIARKPRATIKRANQIEARDAPWDELFAKVGDGMKG
jgi:hypothetical protein